MFDGVDVDWEFPVYVGPTGFTDRPEDRRNMTLLVREFRRQLPRGALVTARPADGTPPNRRAVRPGEELRTRRGRVLRPPRVRPDRLVRGVRADGVGSNWYAYRFGVAS